MNTTISKTATDSANLNLHLKILGRTLEHFGVQMYKQRPAAIAELVANCWDAGSKRAEIVLPKLRDWSDPKAELTITDQGCGMTEEEVEDAYLVLGRNRREDPKYSGFDIGGRRIMGRKGIGKLAGFGIADEMEVLTWRNGKGTKFQLLLEDLKTGDGDVRDVPIPGERFTPGSNLGGSGTKLILRRLRNKNALAGDELRTSLARRFGRIVQGEMAIKVDGKSLPDPISDYDVIKSVPDDFPANLSEHTLPSGKKAKYGYAFTDKTIKNAEMQGFAVMVHGKTAHAPPFFFRVETTASGQHATRYVSGVIEADFLDDATDSKTDVVSTDRQEIDWNHPSCQELLTWGQDLARKALADCTEFRGKRKAEELALNATVKGRIARLDRESKKQVHRLIGAISYTDSDDERAQELVDSLLKIFEFRHFHDMVSDIEAVAEQPALLAERLDLVKEWKVLENRAVYEVIHGRLAIIDMFEQALAKDAPETAHAAGQSNLHDAIGRFPWLLNPDFHIFAEEKTITKLLYELTAKDKIDTVKERIDFCAVGDDKRLIIIEIKRSSHAVEFDEVQRLDGYAEKIARSTERSITRILIFSGRLNISRTSMGPLKKRTDFELRSWGKLFDATKKRYQRYRAILEGEIEHRDFTNAEHEVAEVRSVVEGGSFYRTPLGRKKGLGSQDE